MRNQEVNQEVTKCKCGDRPVAKCDEEWGPKCSLGNSAEYAKRVSGEDPLATFRDEPDVGHFQG